MPEGDACVESVTITGGVDDPTDYTLSTGIIIGIGKLTLLMSIKKRMRICSQPVVLHHHVLYIIVPVCAVRQINQSKCDRQVASKRTEYFIACKLHV